MSHKGLSETQAHIAERIGIDPRQYVVILDNERMICMMHIKTRIEVMIIKQEVKRDRK